MARLASKEKMGYYPLPQSIAEIIRTNITIERGAAAIDLFAGCGTAIKTITNGQASLYGNELSTERFELIKPIMDVSTNGPAEFIEIDGMVSLHYFNPPYDVSSEGRSEAIFLDATVHHLMPGGLFIGIVPEVVLTNYTFVNTLLSYMSNIQVRRFPEPEFDVFKQVVIFATGRSSKAQPSYMGYTNLSTSARRGFPVLGRAEFNYNVPAGYINSFKIGAPTLADSLREIELTGGVFATKQWQVNTSPLKENLSFQPLMKAKPGHAAMMLAAGMMDGSSLGNTIIKGYHYKYVEVENKSYNDEDGKNVHETVETERFANAIVTLDTKTGKIERIDSKENPTEYEEYINDNLGRLLEQVHERYKPLYNGDYSPMVKYFDHIHAPGVLAGHKANGLLEPQKHVVAANVAGFMSGQKGLFLEGDMGVGKTMIAIATMIIMAQMTGMKRVIVLCPTHLVIKWRREAELVGKDYNVKGFICRSIADVDEAFNYDGISFLIMGHQDAKNHSIWEPAAFKKAARVKTTVEEMVPTYYGRAEPVEKEIEKLGKFDACPHCGRLIDTETNIYTKKGSQSYEKQYKCQFCGTPLWTMVPFVKGPRVALAYYINRRYSGFGFINDEAHETKGGDTNIGYATRWLTSASRFTLQMTGTIYNGYASGLFHMAHRGLKSFRDIYEYDAVTKFVDHHGLRQKITKEKSKHSWSSYSGYTRNASVRNEELPGATPGIVAILLPYTSFLHIEDISSDLPEYREYQLAITPNKESNSWKTYAKLIEGELRTEATGLARKGNMALMSMYLQASLGYMDKPEQEEKFEHSAISTITTPPGNWDAVEKDDEVIKLIERENSNGNRVLMYIMQANKRDPMSRIGSKLKTKGIKYAVLRRQEDDSLLPGGGRMKIDGFSREEFVDKAVEEGATVMMCSPELVKTGLDLIQFPVIVFYAPHYSIFLLRQASRRSWRLGQERPVKVVFAYWKETRQADALSHVAKKMRAATLIDGRAISGLGSMDAEKSFLQELVAKAIGAEEPDLPQYVAPEAGTEQIVYVKKNIRKEEALPKRKVIPAQRITFKQWWMKNSRPRSTVVVAQPVRHTVTSGAQLQLFSLDLM